MTPPAQVASFDSGRSKQIRDADFLASAASGILLGPSETVAAKELLFLGIGVLALGVAALAATGAGIIAIPIPWQGFAAGSLTASSGGLAVLGFGALGVGGTNLFLASSLERKECEAVFVTLDRTMQVFFCLSVFARLLVSVVTTHWAMIGVAFLIGADADEVVGITRVILLLAASSVGVGLFLGSRQEGAHGRMALGPEKKLAWSVFVIIAGMSSDVGGALLLLTGSSEAGRWAMILGTSVAVMEMAAIGGAIVVQRISRSLEVER